MEGWTDMDKPISLSLRRGLIKINHTKALKQVKFHETGLSIKYCMSYSPGMD